MSKDTHMNQTACFSMSLSLTALPAIPRLTIHRFGCGSCIVVSFSHQEIQSFKITLFTFVDPWPGEETIWRNVELQLVWLCVLSISQLAQNSKTESYQNPPWPCCSMLQGTSGFVMPGSLVATNCVDGVDAIIPLRAVHRPKMAFWSPSNQTWDIYIYIL